jgi:hypothetical protein
VLNAINDALRPAGISFDHVPVLPAEVCAALAGDTAGDNMVPVGEAGTMGRPSGVSGTHRRGAA